MKDEDYFDLSLRKDEREQTFSPVIDGIQNHKGEQKGLSVDIEMGRLNIITEEEK